MSLRPRCARPRRLAEADAARLSAHQTTESHSASDDPTTFLKAMPFAAWLGIQLDAASPSEVRGRLAWSPDRCTAGGVMHGGALMTLADSVGAVCAFLNLPTGATTATIGSTTSFFRGVRGGEVTAVARPLHVGRATVVVQTDLFDSENRRVALVAQTQAVLSAKANQ